jgi:hypothetical protein
MNSISETLWRANFMVVSWKCNLVWKYDDRICTGRWDSTLCKSVVRPVAYSASLNKFKGWTTGNVIRWSRVVLVFESAGRTGFYIPVRVKDFYLLQKPELALGANILLFGGCRGSFLEVKRSEREVNHSPPTTAEVKNGWSYLYFPYTPSCRGHGWWWWWYYYYYYY